MDDRLIYPEMLGIHIRDVVDVPLLTELFQSYSDLTGMVTALLDLDGEVLIATNWQDSCTKFHRTNKTTCGRCHESDTALAGALNKGDKYNVYRCKNGLVDIAMPVIVNGKHIANFFTGQFFFESPDLHYFEQQALEVGFEPQAYLEAIQRVPVYNEDTIKSHMSFLVKIAEMVGNMGAAKLKIIKENETLERHKQQLQNIVEQRTKELQESLNVAESASKAKSQFLSNMSHELRTPLNAVLGFSQILEAQEDNPKKKFYLHSINVAGKGLLSLINSVLDMAKIESGKMPIQAAPMSIRQLFEEIRTVFTSQATSKKLALILDIADDVPMFIQFDEGKLRQIIFNLVSNALKFTNEGSISVTAKIRHSQAPHNVTLYISVQDSGKGIEDNDKERIFQPFEQAEGQNINEHGGTGLGLPLTRGLVDAMNGTLELESVVGVGSTFSCHFSDVKVLLQSAVDEPANAPEWGGMQFTPATILIVDDNDMNRELISLYLDGWPFNILHAKNGQEGVDMALSHIPDLILMDFKMPVMNGYEASVILKADAKTQHIPIVAVTASAFSHDIALIKEASDYYLCKPVSKTELVAAIKVFLPHSNTSTEQSLLRIIVVDDSEINTLVMAEQLTGAGAIVDTALSGDSALAKLEVGNFDLLITDCEMPGMDGFSLARKARALRPDIRIIGYTADKPSHYQACINAGMNDVVAKPLSDDELVVIMGGRT